MFSDQHIAEWHRVIYSATYGDGLLEYNQFVDDGKSVLGTMNKLCTTNHLLKNRLILFLLSWVMQRRC